MTVERLMRHLSANEYRDSWAKREQRAGQTLEVGSPPDPPACALRSGNEAPVLLLRPGHNSKVALQFIRPGLTWAQHSIVYKTRPQADAALHSLQANLALVSLRPGIHLGTHNQAHNLAQLALERSKAPSLLLKAALLWRSPVSSGPDPEAAPFPPSVRCKMQGRGWRLQAPPEAFLLPPGGGNNRRPWVPPTFPPPGSPQRSPTPSPRADVVPDPRPKGVSGSQVGPAGPPRGAGGEGPCLPWCRPPRTAPSLSP